MFNEKFKKIDISAGNFNPFEKIGKEWFLITAGNENSFNTMTASWGFAGVMWGKNSFISVIRPQRYTKEFIDQNEYFTVSFFKDDCKKALQFCGSHSGRDCDKVKETGLTPISDNNTVAFEEAYLVLVCKKTYAAPMTPGSFIGSENLDKWYPDKDFHVQYIGEIVEAYEKI